MHAIAIIQTKEFVSPYRNISRTISKVAERLVVASMTIQHGTVTIVYKCRLVFLHFHQLFGNGGRRDFESVILCLCLAWTTFCCEV